MSTTARHDAWAAGEAYERYMGRWSRLVAARFLDWLAAPSGTAWLDLGCGTGALTQTILARCNPRSIIGIDPSEGFVAHARATTSDDRARFEVGDAQKLTLADASVDVAASALVLNFVPDRVAALRELQRVVRPGGLLSFYVWDYPGGGMGFMTAFWKAAIALDPNAAELGEGGRFPFCTPEGLAALCAESGLPSVTVAPIEIETRFPSFEDLWLPFTLGAGPAPGYCVSLPADKRAALKERLKRQVGGDGPVSFVARAWAVSVIRDQ
ncbi:class I SAM-dependent methyltransferase [Dongia deserti]|uniref:class I SAM-dependent methyltransferase n=1 Tax=Dongia deserti TaxID=2268030 RepID=UPI000E64E6D0|nr:class I SAM-dependent methyltransferase [Dongia deserti]